MQRVNHTGPRGCIIYSLEWDLSQVDNSYNDFRDINPNNLMIENKRSIHLTIIDFNVARRFLDLNTGHKQLMLSNTGT